MLDPHSVLGVGPKATVAEIKAAYRTLAKQWHPDRHRGEDGAREKFVEIGEAYRLLVGPDRHKGRRAAPAPAAAEVKKRPPKSAKRPKSENDGEDADAVLERIFGRNAKRTRVENAPGMDAVPENPAGATEPDAPADDPRANNSHARAVLSALNALFGRRSRLQAEPEGDALADGRRPPAAADLTVPLSVIMHGGSVDFETPEGKIVPVDIPPGTPDGTELAVEEPERLTFTVRHASTGAIRSDGVDLHGDLAILLDLAVLGGQVPFETLDGSIRLTIPAWSGSDRTLRVQGRGLPNAEAGRGDLFVHLRILLPETPDARLIELLKTGRESFYV